MAELILSIAALTVSFCVSVYVTYKAGQLSGRINNNTKLKSACFVSWHTCHDIPAKNTEIILKGYNNRYHIGYYTDSGSYRVQSGYTLDPDQVECWSYVHNLTL